jgi:hypothetical protein
MVGELFQRPLFQKEPISETLKKPFSVGEAEMRGTVTASAVDSFESIALQLMLDSTTHIRTTNTTDGAKEPNDPKPGKSHPEIGVQFGSTIATTAKTAKLLYLSETGFALSKATTSANSVLLETHGLKAQAQGILPGRRIEYTPGALFPRRVRDKAEWLPIPDSALAPRLKARFAPKSAQEAILEEKAATEQKASQTLSEKINENFNKTTWDELLPIHYKYYSYVYEPLVLKQFLGGRIGMGSNNGWIALRGSKGDKNYLTDISKIPNLPVGPEEPIQMRIHSEVLERLAELRLGGTRMTEVEAAEMMGKPALEDETLENVFGNQKEEVLFLYHDTKPVLIRFNDNKIAMTLRFSEVTSLGQTLKEVQIRRTIAITKSPEGLFLESQAPEPLEFINGKIVPGDLGKHITQRFAKSFEREKRNMQDRVIFSNVKSLLIKSIKAEGDRIYVGMAPALQEKGAQK